MSEQAPKLYPITYRCPGGLKLTYHSTSQSHFVRLRRTLIGGIALWRMWLREFVFLLLTGQAPHPATITLNVARDIERVFQKIRAEAAKEGNRVMAEIPTTESIDWRSIFVRYAKAVMDDDIVVGDRCLTDPDWCPPWTDAERKAVALIRREAWPDHYDFPQSEPNAR